LVALYALPKVAHPVGSVVRSLFGINMVETAVADTTAFGLGRQFDLNTMVVQFSKLILNGPRREEDGVVCSRG
jgi:hypothetical protein